MKCDIYLQFGIFNANIIFVVLLTAIFLYIKRIMIIISVMSLILVIQQIWILYIMIF